MNLQNSNTFNRRGFIFTSTVACLSFAVPGLVQAAFRSKKQRFSVGLIADLHQDVMHDGFERMQAFVETMKKVKPDAILQLGDFAYPDDKNKAVIDLFNNSHTNTLHVIGNHDTDNNHTHTQCVDFWGMPAPYYTKNLKGFRFIILNGNEKNSPTYQGGYPAYIGPEQTEWLKAQLAESPEPVIICCHQPLTGPLSIDNATEIQRIISGAKNKVVLILNGHTHIDSLQYVDEVPYLTINSASYFWVGQNFIHNSYSPEIHSHYPWISRTCPYKDALFATLTIDLEKSAITLYGKKSEWMGASPGELNFNEEPSLQIGREIVPFIRQQSVSVKGRIAM